MKARYSIDVKSSDMDNSTQRFTDKSVTSLLEFLTACNATKEVMDDVCF